MSILIAGDSWGCGEWDLLPNGKYCVTHKGIEQYFIDNGDIVTNISIGGGTNQNSVFQLQQQLSNMTFNCIIWFQTDPLRDLRPYATFNDDFYT